MISDFADMAASVEPVDTVLYGEVRDQAALHGLLDRIQERGLELIEVRRLHAGGSQAHPEPCDSGQAHGERPESPSSNPPPG